MQWLFELCNEHHYVTWNKREQDGVVQLFFCHPKGSTLAQCFPTLVILDCTYKTNQWRMPLLHFVGVTSTNHTFTIAYCFMPGEKVEDYIWALKRLKDLYSDGCLPSLFITDDDQQLQTGVAEVFPEAKNLLCAFHIKRNVCANFKKSMNKDTPEDLEKIKADWDILWMSESEAMYKINLNYVERLWGKTYPNWISYVKTQWLARKEKFVYAWTIEIKHFGNRTTNRVEGQHAILKRASRFVHHLREVKT
ncbi:hypothetical protein MKW94_014784 [Papaver nudicaule]|uniref:MULE transposase domain-containing protein n=1 Tax=Papaver nudicaule TaxID=74823 RepID=A0AA42B0V6_PAPNU|nr:hypothetical protein [Papaver nudicaule]